MSSIEKLGFGIWHNENNRQLTNSGFKPARVISVNKNNYLVSDGINEVNATVAGKFMFEAESPEDYPAVGDWVYVQYFDDASMAVIYEILPRKSLLKRKTPGKKVDYQLIAANIDKAVIIQSLDGNFNLRRLERYIVMINDAGIMPIILLSKADLITGEEAENRKKAVLECYPDVFVLSFSNNNMEEVENIKSFLNPGETYCFLGSSGVGKSTLLNNLSENIIMKTAPVREKDSRGKHTTTRRELIVIDNGAIVIDNPGMRELGFISTGSGLDDSFSEISNLSEQCLFKDCTHLVEKGCAVLKAINDGSITKERYNNYIKMYKESKYHEMSYIEKRQKDKKFSKDCIEIMKLKKDKKY